jgi:uncharacterized protein GlcG (DUF336 family)
MKFRTIALILALSGLANVSFSDDGLQLGNRTVINLDIAKAIAAAAAEYATGKEWTVNIAIVDDGSNLLYFERGDGVQTGSIEIAIRKAKTAAAFKRETRIFDELASSGRVGILSVPDGMILEGGVPITWKGEVLGAVGVSGVKSEQDAEIAYAGIEAVMKQFEE